MILNCMSEINNNLFQSFFPLFFYLGQFRVSCLYIVFGTRRQARKANNKKKTQQFLPGKHTPQIIINEWSTEYFQFQHIEGWYVTDALAFFPHRSSAWLKKFWHMWCLVCWYRLEKLSEHHKWRVSTNWRFSCGTCFAYVVTPALLVLLV